jgi:hypothetical protein
MIIVYAYDQSSESTDNLVLENIRNTLVSDTHLVSNTAGNISMDLQTTQATPEDLKEPSKGLTALREIFEDPTTAPICQNTIPKTPISQDNSITDILMPVKPETMFNIMIQLENHIFQSKPLPPQTQYIWFYEKNPVCAILNVAKIGSPKSPGQIRDSRGHGNDYFDQGNSNDHYAYPILSLAWLKKPLQGTQLEQEYNLDLYQPYQIMPPSLTIPFESLSKDFDVTIPTSSTKKFFITHPAAIVTSEMEHSEDPPESFEVEMLVPVKYRDKVQNFSSDLQGFYDELQSMPTDIILKIKPEHMANIWSQKKNHEFRKYMLPSTTCRIWFYEISPVDAIRYIAGIGCVKFPGEIQDPTGIGNDDFDQNLKESKYGYEILSLQSLPDPISMDQLLRDFHFVIPRHFGPVPPSVSQAFPYEDLPCVFNTLANSKEKPIHDYEDWDPTSHWSPFPLEDRNSDWGIDPYDSDMPGLQDISSDSDSSMQEGDDRNDSDMSEDDNNFDERTWSQYPSKYSDSESDSEDDWSSTEDSPWSTSQQDVSHQDEELEALIQKPSLAKDTIHDITSPSTTGPKALYPKEQLLCRLEETSPISSETPTYVFSITASSNHPQEKPNNTFLRFSRDDVIQHVMQDSKDKLDQDELYIAILKTIRSNLKYSIDRLSAKLRSTEWKQEMDKRLIGDPVFQYVCRECYYFRGSCCNPCIPSIPSSRSTAKADQFSEFNSLLRPEEIDFLQTATQVFHLLHEDDLVDAIQSVLDTRFRRPQRVSTLLDYGFLGP